MNFRELINEPLFLLGCVIRLALIALATPVIHLAWFLPFLIHVPAFGALPWDQFLANGGLKTAFPYGIPYVLTFGPPVWLGDWMGGLRGAALGLGLTIFAFDILLMRLSSGLIAREQTRLLLTAYWLSPATFYIGYWHGQLDMFPIALLLAALLALKYGRLATSGMLFAIAIAAKPSVALAAPFLAIYLLGRHRLRRRALVPIISSILLAAGLVLPFSLLPGFRAMVVDTPEAAKVFSLAAPIGPGIDIYLLPLAYAALLFVAWRIRRLSFDMLCTFIGAAFLALLIFTPASPGWLTWSLPFIAIHTVRTGISNRLLYFVFTLAFVSFHLITSPGAIFMTLDLQSHLSSELGKTAKVASLLMTLVLGSGMTLGLLMMRDGIYRTPFFQATHRPLVIGISGDSGAGKDTLADGLAGLFGDGLVHVSGDNYHSWDRHKPMWRALTHLNPRANDLDAFATDVRMLADGRKIRARHYDHASGRMTKAMPIAAGEVVIASGLHALWSPVLNERFDLRVYLDMDERLRRYLKIQRDVGVRGHERQQVIDSIERRFADAERFIHPQANAADIVFRLEPRRPAMLESGETQHGEIPMRLIVQLRRGQSFHEIGKLLTAFCGLQIVELPESDAMPVLMVEGDPTTADIAAAARRAIPDLRELMALEPKWQDGLRGVMQLLLVYELGRAATRRSLSS